MATTPSQVPVPSEKPQDLRFNAGKLDEFITSMGWTYTDRFGEKHYTIEGLRHYAEQVISTFGYVTMDSFEDGATLTLPNQVLRWESNGEYYRWDGDFPKSIPADSTPDTSGGIGLGSWLSVGDATLRSQISDADGAAKYPELQMARWKDEGDVRYWGAKMDGVTDDTVALNTAFASGQLVKFPEPVNGPCIISAPLLIADNTKVYGPGKDFIVVKCADSMAPDLHAIVTANYANGTVAANKNIHIEGVCVDGNGYVRAPGTDKPAGCCFVINAEDSTIKGCHGIAGPVWNLFVTSANPYETIGHNGAISAPSNRVMIEGFTSTDPIHGDGGIIQGTFDSLIRDYTSVYTSSLVSLGLKVRADTGLQLIEGCRGVTVKNLMADHAGTVTTAIGISAHANKPYMSDIIIDGVQAKNLSTVVGVFNETTEVAVGAVTWRNRRYNIRNVHLQYPVLDTSSTVMQARLVDIQNAMSVRVSNISASFLSDSGAFSSPTAVINLAGVHDFEVDGVEFKDVPDVGTASYAVNRGRGWISIADSGCKRGKIRNVKLDNIGYFNRVISDTAALCLEEITNLVVDSIPSDGQTKVGIVCGSSYVSVNGITIPSGMTMGTIGPIYLAMTQKHTDVMASDYKMIYGGMKIRAHNPSGIQDAPGILFDRQFVSAGSSNGKGSVAFRTSNATPGTWSVAAYNEDTSSYAPIMVVAYQPSNTITKYISPVVDGDTNNGNASARWLNVNSVNGVITTSDERDKEQLRGIEADETLAFSEIARLPMVWKWIRRVEEEGDEARLHSGPTVQAAIAVMNKYNLDWQSYSCFCYDHHDAVSETTQHVEAETDEEGNVISEAYEIVMPAVAEVDKYSFRKEELLWWCMRAIISEFDSLILRVCALESK